DMASTSQCTVCSVNDARGMIRQACSPVRHSNTGMFATEVTIAWFTAKARGCRSAGQLLRSTSGASGPVSSSTLRLAERSTTCPGASPSAALSTPPSSVFSALVARNSSGASHSTAVPCASPATSPTFAGKPAPVAAASAACPCVPGAQRSEIWVVNAISRSSKHPATMATTMTVTRCATGGRRSGLTITVLLAISTAPFQVIEDGCGDYDGNQLVANRGLEHFTDAVAPVLDQR